MVYEVEMKFPKPPMLSVMVEAPNEVTAKVVAQHEAYVGGFGKVKKFTSIIQK